MCVETSEILLKFIHIMRRTPRPLFAHLVRKVSPRGFRAEIEVFTPSGDDKTTQLAQQVALSGKNTLLCGSLRTGKLTLLKMVGNSLAKEHKKRVAFVSADPARANRLGGFLINHFVGLRMSRDDLPSQEQLEGTFERHVRLVHSSFGCSVPSLADIDVLILDALERIPPSVLLGMDAVARRVRREDKVFGGLHVVASANFWEMTVVPSSDTGGYIFQAEEWKKFFPVQKMLTHVFGQDKRLSELTEKALFGVLTEEEIRLLEKPKGKRKADKEVQPTVPMITNLEAITQKAVRFPKQRAIKLFPDKFRQLKQSDVGNFLVNMLIQSTSPASYGLVDGLSLEEGDAVHLLLDGEGVPVKAGSIGTVVKVTDHYLHVKFTNREKVVPVPRVSVSCFHPYFPEVVYEMRQFPLFPREKLCPLTVRTHPHAYNVEINGLRLTDTNDLGCLLARMRSFSDFTLKNTAAFAYLDNMVHEPTRIYYHQMLQKPISSGEQHWCRNCKSFVPTASFFAHWTSCVKRVRWCSECDKTVPLEQLEAHREKHQLVLCLDCGQTVEWRHWDEHRLSCPLMIREITPLNEFLPLRTRQLALEMGLDKRDLHTMKVITKANLPKSKYADHSYRLR